MLDEPACFTRSCVHYLGCEQPDGTEMTERVICKAFLNGIPYSIVSGKDDHAVPIPKQGNTVVYKQATDAEWDIIRSIRS